MDWVSTRYRPAPPAAPAGGTRYQVKQDPGESFTLTCSPTATITSGSGDSGSGYIVVRYRATANPLQLVLSGGIGPQTAKRYLPGQLCSSAPVTGGLTASNYHWSVSGGHPFAFWTSSNTSARLVPLNLATETGSELDFYFKKPDTATVTCTCDLAVPDGAHPVGGFPGTALARTAQIETLPFRFTWQLGSMQCAPQPPAQATSIGFYGLEGHEYGSVGILWNGFATTPPEYVDAYGGFGSWNIVQLVTPNDYVFGQGGQQGHWSLNGLQGLDDRYPTFPVAGGRTPYNFTADGLSQYAGDGPNVKVNDTLTRILATDHLETWMMYQPPGPGSSFVPLRKMTWFWTVDATHTGPGQ